MFRRQYRTEKESFPAGIRGAYLVSANIRCCYLILSGEDGVRLSNGTLPRLAA